MTTIARRIATQLVNQNHSARRGPWTVVTARATGMWMRLGAIVAAGQLGPDPETEISRWSGGRI